MSKPKYLECIYTAPIVFDLEELKINWEQVKNHYVKYGTLSIIYKDGTIQEYEGSIGDPDYKWAETVGLYTDDWDFVEEVDIYGS